ncbi:hypothetical protein QJS10_CPB17g01368 [Acorus calamus]|uniref:C2 domain-containing protein n=1 Tax=Acorus calamus TaxID=4465 RepID=A0AAV9CRN8_ACOCL|nr:hypothetical protein QJS10_CPB17g01368 [Acorus calamus]
MAHRTLEITLISAKDLKNVNLFSSMEVYAVVSVSGDPRSKQKTPTDRSGGRNPSWNHTLRFTVDDSPSAVDRLVLHFLLRAERALGDRDIGEVQVPLKELLSDSSSSASGGSAKFVSYQVRKPSGKPKGVLNFSYKFGERFSAAVAPPPPPATVAPPTQKHKHDEPVTAYPAGSSSGYPPPPGAYPAYPPPPQHAGYAGYPPPPQAAYGYPPPPPAGYPGYPPPPAGYGGYPGYPPVQQPPRKNKFGGAGMGLGAGLLGGALGGLLIGDMISDSGGYDGGYDGGFDDGGGFDF